jgi:hypothetical protein
MTPNYEILAAGCADGTRAAGWLVILGQYFSWDNMLNDVEGHCARQQRKIEYAHSIKANFCGIANGSQVDYFLQFPHFRIVRCPACPSLRR